MVLMAVLGLLPLLCCCVTGCDSCLLVVTIARPAPSPALPPPAGLDWVGFARAVSSHSSFLTDTCSFCSGIPGAVGAVGWDLVPQLQFHHILCPQALPLSLLKLWGNFAVPPMALPGNSPWISCLNPCKPGFVLPQSSFISCSRNGSVCQAGCTEEPRRGFLQGILPFLIQATGDAQAQQEKLNLSRAGEQERTAINRTSNSGTISTSQIDPQ